jgi:hypothetical protein
VTAGSEYLERRAVPAVGERLARLQLREALGVLEVRVLVLDGQAGDDRAGAEVLHALSVDRQWGDGKMPDSRRFRSVQPVTGRVTFTFSDKKRRIYYHVAAH